MTVDFKDGRLLAISDSGRVAASCSLVMQGGLLYAQDLQGDGADGVMALMAFVQDMAQEKPVFFPLREESESRTYKQLRSIASRMGAKPYVEVWVLDPKEILKNGK